MTEEQKKYIIQQYAHGRNKPKQIAEELGGVSVGAVRLFAYQNGWARKSHKYSEQEDDIIIDTIYALAKRLKCRPSVLARRIGQLGRKRAITDEQADDNE